MTAQGILSVLWLIMCRVLHRNQVCRRFNWLSKVPVAEPVPVGVGVCCPSIQLPAQLCKAPMFIVCAGKLRENHLLSCVSTFKQGAQTDRETRRLKEKQTLPSKQLVCLSLSLSKAVAVKQGDKQTDRQNESQMWLKYFQVIYLSTSLKFSTSMELRDAVALQIHAESRHAQLDLCGSKVKHIYCAAVGGRGNLKIVYIKLLKCIKTYLWNLR